MQRPDLFRIIGAEIRLLLKRTSTWTLLAIWLAMSITFSYIFPYIVYRSGSASDFGEDFETMLPGRLLDTVASGLPFFGGAILLILGVISVGSEFGWGMWKTLFTQRPGRGRIFAAKMAALGVMVVPFLVSVLVLGAAASAVIAAVEGAPMDWPGMTAIARWLLGGWVILAVWTAAGVMLATVTQGTGVAIGIGILWALVIEGLLGVFAGGIAWLGWLVDLLLRSNGYSLVRAMFDGAGGEGEGPGAFAGPYVSGTQAMLVLLGYLVLFLGIPYLLLRRRDVT
ncbi:MAG: ABC transporter permease [Chloroflexota bacterium]|nr:ABC transporter permease [Chloroflexota bacterium]